MNDDEASSTSVYRALAATRVEIEPFGVMVGPVGHLAAEAQRLRALEWSTFRVRQLSPTVGAELIGLDLSTEPTSEQLDEFLAALDAYKVVFLRDQVGLTPATQLAAARRIGDVEVHPFLTAENADVPEVVRFEKSADVGGYENSFHHDVTWRAIPSRAAILRAISVPPTGGDTMFSDMHAAFDGLDDEFAARLIGLTARHDYAQAFGHGLSDDEREAMSERFPPVDHPVVAVHPRTGRPYLYVNPYFVVRINEVTAEESTSILRRLFACPTIAEYQCRFRWQPNSVAIWDNHAVQHLAVSDYWPDVRVMDRVSIVGHAPLPFRAGVEGERK